MESNEEMISILVVGDISDETWTGDFWVKKRLSHRDQLKKDSIRRELLGGQTGASTDRALSTAMILSELSVRVTKAPPWWETKNNGLDLEDDNVIGEIYNKALKVESDARDAKKKKAAEAMDKMRKEAEEKAKAEASMAK